MRENGVCVSGQKRIAQRKFVAREARICPHQDVRGPRKREGGGGGGGGSTTAAAVAEKENSMRRRRSHVAYRDLGVLSRVRENQSRYLRFLPTVDGDHLFSGA